VPKPFEHLRARAGPFGRPPPELIGAHVVIAGALARLLQVRTAAEFSMPCMRGLLAAVVASGSGGEARTRGGALSRIRYVRVGLAHQSRSLG
jgi:hypothetical protein